MTIEIRDYPAPRCGIGVTFNHVVWQQLQYPGEKYWVNIDKPTSPYRDAARGPNPWDYFFVQDAPTELIKRLEDPLDLALSGHHDWNLKYQRAIHARVAHNFVLRPEIQAEIDSFKAQFFKGGVLGCYLRGTDKRCEYEATPASEIVATVKAVRDELKPDTIFLATDDVRYHELMQQFGVASLTMPRTCRSLHHNPPNGPYMSGQMALMDAWLLAACEWMAFTPSNFVTIPLIMGQHQSLHRINRYCRITPFPRHVDLALGIGEAGA